MNKAKHLIIKTRENGEYHYDNVVIESINSEYLVVYLSDDNRICFPLVNVIYFSVIPEVEK